MGWSVKVLQPFGVEISGTDLRNILSREKSAELQTFLDAHALIIFREQTLSDEDQVRIMGTFGKVSDEKGDGVRHTFVSNVRSDGLFGAWRLPFHSDYGTFQPVIAPVISLYGYELRGPSMPTMFANLSRGYAALPSAQKTEIANLKAVHAVDMTLDIGAVGFENRCFLLKMPEAPSEYTHPRQIHPLVKPHPRTGKPMLYLCEQHISHIEGFDSDSSEALIQAYFARLYDMSNVYVHHWSQGDLVIWDNIATQHGRKPMADSTAEQVQSTRRTLRRTVVCDQTVAEIFKDIKYNNTSGFQETTKAAAGAGY